MIPQFNFFRLCLGTNYCFVVVHPTEAAGPPPEGGWPEVDWDMLNREIARAQVLSAYCARRGREMGKQEGCWTTEKLTLRTPSTLCTCCAVKQC